MKAVFITIHVGFNFGSKLQTIATQVILKKVGYDEVECVNYIPPRVTFKRYWQDALKGPKRFVKQFLLFPVYICSLHQFYGYLKKHCNLSKPIFAEDDFSKKCPKADVYVSGSDQLWNYKYNEGIDGHYFYDGVKGKKVALASSIGMKELPQEYADYMRDRLRNYDAISVREDTAVILLKDLGITATHVLDPTLMLDKDEWKRYMSKRLVKESYVFVYLPYNIVDKELIYKTVRLIADKKGLTVVSYSNNILNDKFADKTIKFVTPGDVLSLFFYADIVITNSFHGTAFSINLNKQFWVYMPSSFSTRIQSILDLCLLNHRLLSDIIDEEQIKDVIDYKHPNSIISKEREKALVFFTKALK